MHGLYTLIIPTRKLVCPQDILGIVILDGKQDE